MEEQWKDIEGFENKYQISTKGRVRTKKELNFLTPVDNGNGYMRVGLYKNGSRYTKTIHRLIATAFMPNPKNKPQINHIDGDRSNNELDNLEWCTQSENMQHAIEMGTTCKGEKSPRAILTKTKVLDIRNAYRLRCFTQKEIAKAYGVARSTIGNIVNYDKWTHI